jgi:hypothetical protein
MNMHTAHQCSAGTSDEITIRLSGPEDRAAILRLANLDGRRPPSGDAILAIVSGELRAALPLGGGDAIADPFRPTTELVKLLRVVDAAQPAGGRTLSQTRNPTTVSRVLGSCLPRQQAGMDDVQARWDG